MRIKRLKRTCGKCRNFKKRKNTAIQEFFCKIFGYEVSERRNAIGCKYYGKYKKELK